MKIFDARAFAFALQDAFNAGAEWRESQPVRTPANDAHRKADIEARRRYPVPQTAREILSRADGDTEC